MKNEHHLNIQYEENNNFMVSKNGIELSNYKTDNINPSHYKLSDGLQVIDILKIILTPEQYIGFLRGNIFKYDIRYKEKNGVEDLKKAQWYKEKLIEVECGK